MQVRKVLYFLDTPYSFGGAASTLLKQAAAMKKYMLNVLVTIPINGEGYAIEEFSSRCRQYGLQYSFQKYSTFITTEMIDVIGLSEDYDSIITYINDFNPDLVHSTQINVCVELACRKLGIPHVMNVYQCTEYNFPMLYPDIFPRYHICDSEIFVSRWRKRLQLDSMCIRNVCNMIKVEKHTFSEPVIICVGGINKRKNQLELIKAIHRLVLENMPIHLQLIGDSKSEYGKKCIEYIEKNDIGDWIEICGYIPFAEKEIAKSEVLVCCSINESFPNVIGTAMANKTIIITTPVGGVPEILKNNENAYVSTGFNAEDLYVIIRKFYIQRGTKFQENLVENAFQIYMNEFSQEAVESKLLSYYDYIGRKYKKENYAAIKVKDILMQYYSYVVLFKKNWYNFQNPDIEKYMLWLIPYIKRSLQNKSCNELIIWGAGLYGEEAIRFAKLYFSQLSIRSIIDKNKMGECFGYPIVKVNNVDWKDTLVWIAFLHGQMEAVETLQDMGLKYHKDFFFLAPVNL